MSLAVVLANHHHNQVKWSQSIGFEGGAIGTYPDGFDSVASDGGATIAVSTDAKHSGTNGAAVALAAGGYAMGRITGPSSATRISGEWWINRNDLAMGAGESHRILSFYNTVVDFTVTKVGANFVVKGIAYLDSGSQAGDTFNLGTGWHKISFSWAAASAAGANNGRLSYSYDGAQVYSIATLNNDTKSVSEIRVGNPTNDVDAGTSGTYYIDDIKVKYA